MAAFLRELIKGYNTIIYEKSDQRTIHWPLMASPVPVMAIIGLYYWFVFKAGPAFMKNRQPFQLDRIIQIYNLVQVFLCSLIVYVGVTSVYGPWGRYSFFCAPLDFAETEFNMLVLRSYYLFFLLKILDLLDTVFFILRKKSSQVTFLHVYHHSCMVLFVWGGMRFIPGGHYVFLGAINSFVHSVMYFYYFLANLYKGKANILWWKKYITQLQILQFFILLIHTVSLLVHPNCNFPKVVTVIFIPQDALMIFMFSDFYRKSYLRPKVK